MKLQSIPGGWRTVSEIVHNDKKADITVFIEPGFETDLASIPSIFRVYVSNQDHRIRKPAIIHDFLYKKRGRCNLFDSWLRKKLTRKEVDQVFYRHLRKMGVGKIKSYLMYLAVRIGGAFFWDE